MAFTQADVDLLDAAIVAGRGARTMAFSDQTVTFHSVDEMLRLRSVMLQEVTQTAGRVSTRLAAFSKGA